MTWQEAVVNALEGPIVEEGLDGGFVLELAHPRGPYDYGDFATFEEAEGERLHLIAKAKDGTMLEETIGEILSNETFDALGKLGTLPPGLMATWRESTD